MAEKNEDLFQKIDVAISNEKINMDPEENVGVRYQYIFKNRKDIT